MKRLSRVLLRNGLVFLFCWLAWPPGAIFAQKKVDSSVTGALPDFNSPVSDFAGPELCRECHKDESVRNDKTRHWQMVFPGKDYIHSCETCHGPAKGHVESAILEFIDVHNEQPKLFVWTKSADAILNSIGRFTSRTLAAPGTNNMQEISDSED